MLCLFYLFCLFITESTGMWSYILAKCGYLLFAHWVFTDSVSTVQLYILYAIELEQFFCQNVPSSVAQTITLQLTFTERNFTGVSSPSSGCFSDIFVSLCTIRNILQTFLVLLQTYLYLPLIGHKVIFHVYTDTLLLMNKKTCCNAYAY